MESNIRITCPDINLPKEARLEDLFSQIGRWIYSPQLASLVSLFGESAPVRQSGSLQGDLAFLHEFAKQWDFRKGRERWAVTDEAFVQAHAEQILDCAAGLGLTSITEPAISPDYLLPLGGARLSNMVRPAAARKIIDHHAISGKKVIALSGTRPISDAERPYTDEYAPNAATEYDAINKGLERAFPVDSYHETLTESENLNLCSAIRVYDARYRDCEILSLAAPSSEPEKRRANSYDTFRFLLDTFSISRGDKLLLITSCIYVPFQLLKFMDLAIEDGFEVDCVGADVYDRGKFSKPSNYLQEIKSTIDASFELGKRYL